MSEVIEMPYFKGFKCLINWYAVMINDYIFYKLSLINMAISLSKCFH